jgi:hypothetical protein
MVRVSAIMVLVAAGAVWYAIAGENPQTTACMQEIKFIEAAYRAHPPKAESHKAIENTLRNARNWCGDKKFKEADAGIDMAAFLCVANKGCKPLLDEARRLEQSSR